METQQVSFKQVVTRGCGLDVHKKLVVATIDGEGIKKQTLLALRNAEAFQTTVGIQKPIPESDAVALDAEARRFISVAKLNESDFTQWGFRAFFHQPNDYLINKMKEAGAGFRVVDDDGEINISTLPTLDLLRDMVRSRNGEHVPKIISDILDKYDTQQLILLENNLTNAQIEKAKKVADVQLKKLQVELFKLALDLHMERYVYDGMGREQRGQFQIDARGYYIEEERLPYGTNHEIETISGRAPLDFIDRETFIQSVVQYSNSLVRLWMSPADISALASGTLEEDLRIDNMPDRAFIVELMKQKGIIGTSRQAEIDRRALQMKDRFGSVPDRVKRQQENIKETATGNKH